jgi:hypothetical protein
MQQPTPQRQADADAAYNEILKTCHDFKFSPLEFVSLLCGIIANTEIVLSSQSTSKEELRESVDAVLALARNAVDLRTAQAKN